MQGEISVIDSTAQVQIDQTAATASVQAATIRATQEAAGDGAIQRAIVKFHQNLSLLILS